MPVGSPGSAMEAAERGMTIGVLNTGWVRTPPIFEAYRKKAAEVGRPMTPQRLAYMALIGVGDTREEGGGGPTRSSATAAHQALSHRNS